MFLQSCFIRNNTPRLRERLQRLGYDIKEISLRSECIATAPNVSKAIGISKDMFNDNNPHRTWNCNGRIDCGTDEYLFLAIAALRNDTDKNQWFVNKEGEFCKCFSNEFSHFTFDSEILGVLLDNLVGDCCSPCEGKPLVPHEDTKDWHKATVEELINFFNKRNI